MTNTSKFETLYYAPEIGNGHYELDEKESAHCTRVLRKSTGDEIRVTDGAGSIFRCRIIGISSGKCRFRVLWKEQSFHRDRYPVHIAISPTRKSARFEWFLEKSTEIGIHRITPLITRYSEKKNLKISRMRKILIAAMKQSGRSTLPVLDEMITFEHFIGNEPVSPFTGLICHMDNADGAIPGLVRKEGHVIILIGPEGGFSKDEVRLAQNSGYKIVTLGPYRYRTETAGIMACNMVRSLEL